MKRVIYAALHMLAIFLLKFLLGFKVTGGENIPLRGGVIVAPNHISFLDPPAVGAAIPREAYYIAKRDLFNVPIWGRFLRLANAFPVHREGFDRGAIRKAINYLRQGRVLVLFPEGARSFTGEFLPPLPGVGMIAWESKAVVVPAYIKGSDKALPQYAKFIRFKKVEVIFGKPFSPEKLFSPSLSHRELYSKISQYIMDEIANLGVR